MNTSPNLNSDKNLWHITVDLAYEGSANESGRDGVLRVLSALSPLIENGGFKNVIVMRLPEKA
jgi:hypothetical protein